MVGCNKIDFLLLQDLEALKQSGHVEELHVIDWFGAVELPATNGYRRLDAYLQSSLIQLQIEQFPLNGIFEVTIFICLVVAMRQCNMPTCNCLSLFAR